MIENLNNLASKEENSEYCDYDLGGILLLLSSIVKKFPDLKTTFG